MARDLFLNAQGRKVPAQVKGGKVLDLIEQRGANRVYVNQENTRNRVLESWTAPQWVRNSAGLYVAHADETRADGLRVMSPGLNMQERRETGEVVHYDDGFAAPRAVETTAVQEETAPGVWEDIPMTSRPARRAPAGKEGWSGYIFEAVSEGRGALQATRETGDALGKATFRYTAGGAFPGRYRLKLAVRLSERNLPAVWYPMGTSRRTETGIEMLGTGSCTWEWSPHDAITFSWADMLQEGTADLAASSWGQQGATIYSIPFNLAPGESFEVDPVITPIPSGSGEGSNGGSAWSINGSNEIACGNFAPNYYRMYMRFSQSPIVSGDTINDVDLYYRVVFRISGFAYNSAIWGGYNGDGRGNPATDAFATAFGRADVSADFYVSGDTAPQTDGDKNLDLTAAADTDYAAALVDGFFTVCCRATTESTALNSMFGIAAHTYGTTAFRPVLTTDYTTSGGGGVVGPRAGTLCLMGVGR